MIKAQGGIVGWVSDSTRFLAGLGDAVAEKAGNGTGSKAAMAGAAMA
jgi:hypothetical protein